MYTCKEGKTILSKVLFCLTFVACDNNYLIIVVCFSSVLPMKSIKSNCSIDFTSMVINVHGKYTKKNCLNEILRFFTFIMKTAWKI